MGSAITFHHSFTAGLANNTAQCKNTQLGVSVELQHDSQDPLVCSKAVAS